MNDKKDIKLLEEIFSAGDSWLLRYGVISPVAHNNIVANLYVHFPQAKYVEYFMNVEERAIEVIMHFDRWYLFKSFLFRKEEKLIDDVFSLLREYLHDYKITVRVKRYKKGIEKLVDKETN